MIETLFTLVAAALAIWALVAVAKNQAPPKRKAVWFAIVILVPILGPLLYFNISKRFIQ